MPGPVQQNFNIHAFHQATQNVADDQNLVLNAQGFKAKGKLGTFFAGKTASRNAANALFAALQKEYGRTIADALSPQLRDSMIKGKPLSARTVQNVLSEASAAKHMIEGANASFARAYMGERTLETSLAHLFSDFKVPEDANQREKMLSDIKWLLVYTAFKSDRPLGFADLENLAAKVMFDAMQDVAADRLSDKHGLNEQQSGEMRQLVRLAAAYVQSDASAQTSLSDICAKAEKGELPGQNALLAIFGKEKCKEAEVLDTMKLSNDANRVDMALLSEALRYRGCVGLNLLVMENLPAIRQMQPEGPISRENLWKGCFKEEMPAKLAAFSQNDFNEAMTDRLQAAFMQAAPQNPMAHFTGPGFLACGIKLEKCLEAVKHPVSLTTGDFNSMSSLTDKQNIPQNMDGCEKQLARDLQRRGNHNAIKGFSPTVSFNTPEQRLTMDFANYDKDAIKSGEPSQITADLKEQCLALCKGNDVQARMLMTGLSQAGTVFSNFLSPVTGVQYDEHSPHHYEVTLRQDGSIDLRIFTPHDAPLDADYTFNIKPNGDSIMTNCRIAPAGSDPASNIRRDPRLAGMSEAARSFLEEQIGQLMETYQGAELQAAIEGLKKIFLGIPPEGGDIDGGMKMLAEDLKTEFLIPSQQKKITDGFHESFAKDANRDGIASLNGVPVPNKQSPEYYMDTLKNAVPEEHHKYLPFISMMISQAGINSMPLFFADKANIVGLNQLYASYGLLPAREADKKLSVTSTENGLRIELEYSMQYRKSGSDDPAVLNETGRITLEIDFSAEGTEHQVEVAKSNAPSEQRTVHIPQFTLTNGSLHLEAVRD